MDPRASGSPFRFLELRGGREGESSMISPGSCLAFVEYDGQGKLGSRYL